MKRIIQFVIALVVLGNVSGVLAQGIMFPELPARITIPQVSDIDPRKLPDLFRGSQLTVLGRYSGAAATAPLILKGKIRSESRSLKYEKNEFPNISTANDFLPRL
jgi:hypothetical protein